VTAINIAHILIVVDDATEGRLLRHRLEELGYRCDCATDCTQVEVQIAANDYDVVVLDLIPPTTGGHEILSSIRRERSLHELPVIVITDRDATRDMVTAFDSGANDYVSKPINFDILAARLHNQIRLRRSAREFKRANEHLENRVAERTRRLADRTRDLEARARELDTVIESVFDLLMMVSVDGTIVRCNSRVRRMLGYTQAEVIGHTITRVMPNVSRRAPVDLLSGYVEEDSNSPYGPKARQVSVRGKDGTRIATEFFVSELKIAEDVYYLLSFRDISERRENEHALVLRDQAIDATGLGLMITTAAEQDCITVDVNRAFELITGYSHEEMMGRNPRFLQGAGDAAANDPELTKIRLAIRNGHSARALLKNIRKDGKAFWNELSIAPVFDDANRPSRFVGVIRDVTDRVAADEKLRLMADALPVLLVYFDREGRFQLVNRTAQQWYAQPASAMLGRRARDLIADDAFQVYRQHVKAAGIEAECIFETELTYPDGVTRMLEIHHIPQLDADGSLAGYYTMAIDITERERARAQLVQAQRIDSIGQLSGGIAHDFNNLLSIIKGNLQLLMRRSDPPLDENTNRRLNSAIDAVNRGAGLTHRLLAFSRRQRLERTAFHINERLQDMHELLERASGELIELRTILAADLPLIEGDLSQVENAVLNLVVNACDAMPDGGTLTIESGFLSVDTPFVGTHGDVAPGEYVTISVTDTGHGMTREVLERAFEPFFSTKESGRGTGLGLASVFGYVKQCGGEISLWSEVGTGTTVRLYFPISEAVEFKRGSIPMAHDGDELGSETILVVDDNAEVREAVSELLHSLGYQVLEAENGVRALDMLNDHPGIDLLFTDMVMPGGLSGFELAERARLDRPELKVLFTSGYAEEEMRRQGSAFANSEWINKPVDIKHLASTIRRLLDSVKAVTHDDA
jgi:PAS domain S-box-containing protein